MLADPCVVGGSSRSQAGGSLGALDWKPMNGGLFYFSYWSACKPVPVLSFHRGLYKGKLCLVLKCFLVPTSAGSRPGLSSFVFLCTGSVEENCGYFG